MTITDIAKLAGVSKTTVSRVLNDSGYVSLEKRKNIEKIIEEKNYTPSAMAVNLSKKSSKSISVIVPEISNSFFGELMQGLSEVAQKKDYVLTYCNTENDADLEEKAIDMVQSQNACGIIITPTLGYFDDNKTQKLSFLHKDAGLPIVVVDRGIESSNWDGIFYENFQSTYIATKELIKVGHREIGIITGDMKLAIANERLNGYCSALEDNGIMVKEELIYNGDFSAKTSYEITKTLFESKSYPKAMVTCNNYTSLGFLKACSEYGIQIGKDISLIGIDHIPSLEAIGYPFSVVTRDAVQMGRQAMDMLLYRLENPSAQKKVTMIPCDLYLRGSEKLQ